MTKYLIIKNKKQQKKKDKIVAYTMNPIGAEGACLVGTVVPLEFLNFFYNKILKFLTIVTFIKNP